MLTGADQRCVSSFLSNRCGPLRSPCDIGHGTFLTSEALSPMELRPGLSRVPQNGSGMEMSKINSNQHEPEFNKAKFKEMVLYVASRLAGDPSNGSIKLNKVMAISEFLHYKRFGTPIAGA